MSTAKMYKFAVVPKETINPFYENVYDGCMDMAALLPEAECLYHGTDCVNATEQAVIIRELINRGDIDGISMAVTDVQIATELAQEALDANIPFITFDSDAPESTRLLYVGTDNFGFGQSLAKVLLQLSPKGGIYGIIDASPPNVALRSEGVRYRLKNTPWTESPASPKDCKDFVNISLQHMYAYASLAPAINAIIPVGGWPMRDSVNWKIFVDANRNLTLSVGDMDPEQLSLVAKTYVDGLVGQAPYQMGIESIRLLLELASGKPAPEGSITSSIITTSLVEVVRVPLTLPRIVVNENQIGNLKYVGFVGTGITFLLAIAFVVFTFINRKRRVVKASQPLFLYMICFGVILMASAMIPLSVDDSWNGHSERGCNIACMSFPWLLSLGFATTFSGLFSKTWRVNKIFRTTRRFVRKEVSAKDVIVPFAFMLTGNVIVLSLWTALAPLEYSRQPHEGTDDWNRVISTYGACYSPNALPYAIVLGLMNFGLLIVSNFQAYRARSIQSEFSESKYIGIVMASMLQTTLIGFPIVFLVNDNPQAVYLVVTFMIFVTCMAILLLIFVPKIYHVKFYGRSLADVQRSELKKMKATLPSSHFYEDRQSRRSTPSQFGADSTVVDTSQKRKQDHPKEEFARNEDMSAKSLSSNYSNWRLDVSDSNLADNSWSTVDSTAADTSQKRIGSRISTIAEHDDPKEEFARDVDKSARSLSSDSSNSKLDASDSNFADNSWSTACTAFDASLSSIPEHDHPKEAFARNEDQSAKSLSSDDSDSKSDASDSNLADSSLSTASQFGADSTVVDASQKRIVSRISSIPEHDHPTEEFARNEDKSAESLSSDVSISKSGASDVELLGDKQRM